MFDKIKHDVSSRKPLLTGAALRPHFPPSVHPVWNFGASRDWLVGDNSCIELSERIWITRSPHGVLNFPRKEAKEFICMKLKCTDSEKNLIYSDLYAK